MAPSLDALFFGVPPPCDNVLHFPLFNELFIIGQLDSKCWFGFLPRLPSFAPIYTRSCVRFFLSPGRKLFRASSTCLPPPARLKCFRAPPPVHPSPRCQVSSAGPLASSVEVLPSRALANPLLRSNYTFYSVRERQSLRTKHISSSFLLPTNPLVFFSIFIF